MSISTDNLINTTGIQLKKDAFVVIVKTEWNEAIIDVLQQGCIEVLEANNVSFKVIEVPGAFEIPFAIQSYWQAALAKLNFKDEQYNNNIAIYPDAFIALGCVIKGDTPHFDYVCQGVTNGIMQLNTTLPVPVIYGVLTVLNLTQVNERIGGIHGHKGKEAAAAAIKMMAIEQQF